MIGPLAKVELPEPETAEPPKATSIPLAAPAAPLPKQELPLDKYPIERCAAIAARIVHRRVNTPNILEEHELTPDTWAALEKHWTSALRVESERGKTALLSAYDSAYVAALEDARGPILVDEYAKIVVGAERGKAAEALAALDLPRGAGIRIERVWLKKTGDDTALAAEARRAVDAAREA